MIITLLTGGNSDTIKTDIVSVVNIINRELGTVISTSSIYESEPFGFKSEHNFLNQVLIIESDLLPNDLLFKIWDIERLFGRKRGNCSEELVKWQERDKNRVYNYSSRAMDIDILLYGDLTIKTEYLQIPHKEIHKRQFVLRPMIELLGENYIINGLSLGDSLLTLESI